MARRPLTVPTSGTRATAEDYGDNPTPLAVWVTPDGAAVGGPGAWQQLAALVPQAYAANWAVTDWYLDGTVGNDANNGTTALTPLRTGAELMRRLGPYALWGQSVTVHVLANGMTDALILRGAMLVAGTHLDIVGTPTTIASDVVSAWAPLNHATPTRNHLTGTAIADFTAFERKRLRVTSGVRANTISWIAKANPGGLGLNVAAVSPTIAVNTASATSPMTQSAALVAGDPFDLETLPSMPSIAVTLNGPTASLGSLHARRQCTVSNVDAATITLSCDGVTSRGLVYVFGSRVSLVQVRNSEGQIQFVTTPHLGNSFYKSDPSTSQLYVYHGGANCLFGDGHTQTLLQSSSLWRSSLWQGTNVSSRVYVEGDDNQIFDVQNVAAGAFVCQLCFWKNTSGSGNLGFGAVVSNNANYRLTNTWNVRGAVADVQLSAAPAINLTIAQFLQPSDYAQKGTTAAMVAGTITMTVPWYDNAVQKVTVSHAVFAGTPGILSVQQISNTQFTITSSSAIDTSTVNWQISALGRNILLATT